jgi:hypothetical protein
MGTGTTGLVSKELNRNYRIWITKRVYRFGGKKNKRIRWKSIL